MDTTSDGGSVADALYRDLSLLVDRELAKNAGPGTLAGQPTAARRQALVQYSFRVLNRQVMTTGGRHTSRQLTCFWRGGSRIAQPSTRSESRIIELIKKKRK